MMYYPNIRPAAYATLLLGQRYQQLSEEEQRHMARPNLRRQQELQRIKDELARRSALPSLAAPIGPRTKPTLPKERMPRELHCRLSTGILHAYTQEELSCELTRLSQAHAAAGKQHTSVAKIIKQLRDELTRRLYANNSTNND